MKKKKNVKVKAAADVAAGSVVPGVGTIAGGLLGGLAGAYGGEKVGESTYDWVSGKARMQINIRDINSDSLLCKNRINL